MNNENELKNIVREKYSKIALQSSESESNSCCSTASGSSSCGCGSQVSSSEYSDFSESYENLGGYVPESDLKLGCGLPTQFAGINSGDTVVDLGSGAGNDVFVARSLVGESGQVIGIDMTAEMIQKAEKNNLKLGYNNVKFIFGEIENMPIEDNTADVVISNCVLNLVPDKRKAFSEINRILKPGAHFCISDVVLRGRLPEGLKKSVELYAGCVSGALEEKEYLNIINESGFEKVEIKIFKKIFLPEELLREYASFETEVFNKNSTSGIFSITVTGSKMK